jgi:hypothetical protein
VLVTVRDTRHREHLAKTRQGLAGSADSDVDAIRAL